MDIINLQYDIELARANSMFEFALDNYYLECKKSEVYSDMLYMEDAKETANKGLISKFGEFIEKVIDNIKIFVNKIVNKFKGNKENKEMINKLNEAEKVVKNDNEKIELYDMTNEEKIINEYIKEMVKLERKLMNIKIDISKMDFDEMDDRYNAQEKIREIKKELVMLEKKYGIEQNYDNYKLIKLAKKDAIRFSKKQLENVEVDFEEYKKGSEKILKQFKKDANGCKHPIKLNVLKRIINSVSTAYRKHSLKRIEYTNRNKRKIGKLLAGLGVIGLYVGHRIVKNKIDNIIDDATKHSSSTNKKTDFNNDDIIDVDYEVK